MPKEGPVLMSPIMSHLISICHKLAWLLEGTLGVDLNSLDPAPPQSRFLACGGCSVDLPDHLHGCVGLGKELGIETRGHRNGQRPFLCSLSKQAGHLAAVRKKSSCLTCFSQHHFGDPGDDGFKPFTVAHY